jgi:hypothetical protein
MKTYSAANTILVWTNNQDIIRFSSDIAEDLKLNIYHADVETDLMAVPCFLMIVDSEKLKEIFLSDFNKIAKHMDDSKCSIVVFGKRLTNVPYYVKALIKYGNKIITKEYIHNLILKAMNSKKNIKQNVFREKIHRIIFLYKLLNEGKGIVTNEICELFEISDRTLRRDIKVLRDVCDNEIFFDKDKGYYFQ